MLIVIKVKMFKLIFCKYLQIKIIFLFNTCLGILITTVFAFPQDEGCIKIKSCPAAINHVKNIKNDKSSLDILEKAHCGFDGREPVVKCSSIPNLPNITSNVECVPLQDCPVALRLIEKNVFNSALVNTLRMNHCGETKTQPLVICSKIVGI